MKQIFKNNVFKAIAIGLVMLACLIPVSASAACSAEQVSIQKQVYINGKLVSEADVQNAAGCSDNINCTTSNRTDCNAKTADPECAKNNELCTAGNAAYCAGETTSAQTQAPAAVTQASNTQTKAPAEQTKAPVKESQAQKPVTKAPATTVPAQTTKPEAAAQTQPATGTGSSVSATEREVVRLVNEIRRANGLMEFKLNEELSKVARVKAEDMAANKYFSHTSPTYGSPFDMMKKFGISYRTAGENIAMGQTSAQAVVDAWMNSPGHRANILNASFTQIGVGHVANGNYWVQMFIG